MKTQTNSSALISRPQIKPRLQVLFHGWCDTEKRPTATILAEEEKEEDDLINISKQKWEKKHTQKNPVIWISWINETWIRMTKLTFKIGPSYLGRGSVSHELQRKKKERALSRLMQPRWRRPSFVEYKKKRVKGTTWRGPTLRLVKKKKVQHQNRLRENQKFKKRTRRSNQIEKIFINSPPQNKLRSTTTSRETEKILNIIIRSDLIPYWSEVKFLIWVH